MTDLPPDNVTPLRKPGRVSRKAIAQARAVAVEPVNPFQHYPPPPGVLPEGKKPTLAMDFDPGSGVGGVYGWAGAYGFHEGLQFLGFPYLSELTQRPEYRRPSEILAKEMTRKWIKLTYSGEDDATKKLDALMTLLENFKVRDLFRRAAEQDGFFGRSHLYVDTGQGHKADVLKSPLVIDKRTIRVGMLKGFKLIEPVWTYPNAYNSSDPLDPHFYRPQQWYVMGKAVHTTRLLTFVGREMPDLLKPAYQFGGLSLSQMAKPYVDNWLRTRQSVSDLLHSYSKDVIKTNMATVLEDGGAEQMMARADLYNATRDNRGVTMIDKDSEDFVNVSTPLGTLDKLQAQAQEQQASVLGIPLIILLGITPSGLNASADGEIKTFYAWVKAQQEHLFGSPLMRVLHIIQLHEWGEIDPHIGFTFEDLWETDDAADATNRKTQADTDAVYAGLGAIDAEDIRTRLAGDEESPYFGLDLSAPLPSPPDTDVPDDSDGEQPPA